MPKTRYVQKGCGEGAQGEIGQHLEWRPSGVKHIKNFLIESNNCLRQIPGVTSIPVDIRTFDKVMTFRWRGKAYTVVYDPLLKLKYKELSGNAANPNRFPTIVDNQYDFAAQRDSAALCPWLPQNSGTFGVANNYTVSFDFNNEYFEADPSAGSNKYRFKVSERAGSGIAPTAEDYKAQDTFAAYFIHSTFKRNMWDAFKFTSLYHPGEDALGEEEWAYRTIGYVDSSIYTDVINKRPKTPQQVLTELYARSNPLSIDFSDFSLLYTRFLVYDEEWNLLTNCVERPIFVQEDSGEVRTGNSLDFANLKMRPSDTTSEDLRGPYKEGVDEYYAVPVEDKVYFISRKGRLPMLSLISTATPGKEIFHVRDTRLDYSFGQYQENDDLNYFQSHRVYCVNDFTPEEARNYYTNFYKPITDTFDRFSYWDDTPVNVNSALTGDARVDVYKALRGVDTGGLSIVARNRGPSNIPYTYRNFLVNDTGGVGPDTNNYRNIPFAAFDTRDGAKRELGRMYVSDAEGRFRLGGPQWDAFLNLGLSQESTNIFARRTKVLQWKQNYFYAPILLNTIFLRSIEKAGVKGAPFFRPPAILNDVLQAPDGASIIKKSGILSENVPVFSQRLGARDALIWNFMWPHDICKFVVAGVGGRTLRTFINGVVPISAACMPTFGGKMIARVFKPKTLVGSNEIDPTSPAWEVVEHYKPLDGNPGKIREQKVDANGYLSPPAAADGDLNYLTPSVAGLLYANPSSGTLISNGEFSAYTTLGLVNTAFVPGDSDGNAPSPVANSGDKYRELEGVEYKKDRWKPFCLQPLTAGALGGVKKNADNTAYVYDYVESGASIPWPYEISVPLIPLFGFNSERGYFSLGDVASARLMLGGVKDRRDWLIGSLPLKYGLFNLMNLLGQTPSTANDLKTEINYPLHSQLAKTTGSEILWMKDTGGGLRLGLNEGSIEMDRVLPLMFAQPNNIKSEDASPETDKAPIKVLNQEFFLQKEGQEIFYGRYSREYQSSQYIPILKNLLCGFEDGERVIKIFGDSINGILYAQTRYKDKQIGRLYAGRLVGMRDYVPWTELQFTLPSDEDLRCIRTSWLIEETLFVALADESKRCTPVGGVALNFGERARYNMKVLPSVELYDPVVYCNQIQGEVTSDRDDSAYTIEDGHLYGNEESLQVSCLDDLDRELVRLSDSTDRFTAQVTAKGKTIVRLGFRGSGVTISGWSFTLRWS